MSNSHGSPERTPFAEMVFEKAREELAKVEAARDASVRTPQEEEDLQQTWDDQLNKHWELVALLARKRPHSALAE
ncbi:MAG: hypothetical protein WD557_09830 [Dehalococcoidia bacterium]